MPADRGAEARAEVGHAARQAGDLALLLLGEADCTTFTDGVSITPTPRPMRRSPGANAQTLGEPFTRASRTTTPAIVVTKPADDQRPLRVPLGQSFGGERRQPGCRRWRR